jgi:hypothetical protein
MQTVDAPMHFLQGEASDQYMMQCHFVSLVPSIGSCYKEKMTDLHVIIRVLEESLQRTSRLISLDTCVITWKT